MEQDRTNLGALPRTPDERDLLLGAVQAPAAIPATFLPDNSWLIRNYQGSLPACSAHAASHLQAILEHVLTPDVAQRYTPRFTWIDIKSFDGFPPADGTDMRSIFKSLQKSGADDFEPLENDVTLPLAAYTDPSAITPEMTANAWPKAIQSYAFAGTDFESLCQAIYQNKAVLLLIKCDDAWWTSTTPTFTTPKYGHFVCADGYSPEGIRVIDSADPNDAQAVKTILKEYITPQFFFEAGTAVDLPPSVQAVAAHPALTPQERMSIIQQIIADIKAAAEAIAQEISPKVANQPT